MNGSILQERESIALVEIVQFKWLMAHEGRQVHVERMQDDPAYLAESLAWAEASQIPSLRLAAAALRAAFQRSA